MPLSTGMMFALHHPGWTLDDCLDRKPPHPHASNALPFEATSNRSGPVGGIAALESACGIAVRAGVGAVPLLPGTSGGRVRCRTGPEEGSDTVASDRTARRTNWPVRRNVSAVREAHHNGDCRRVCGGAVGAAAVGPLGSDASRTDICVCSAGTRGAEPHRLGSRRGGQLISRHGPTPTYCPQSRGAARASTAVGGV